MNNKTGNQNRYAILRTVTRPKTKSSMILLYYLTCNFLPFLDILEGLYCLNQISAKYMLKNLQQKVNLQIIDFGFLF